MAAIYMRMLGYSLTLAMHVVNLFLTSTLLDGPVMEDPNIKTFTALYKRFFTVWTMFLQIFMAVMGLTTDYLTLKYSNRQEPRLLGILKSTRNRIFAAILWPTAFLVSTMFWSLYHYDRSLIYPVYADKILTSTSNHIMHTAIIPLMLWEVMFQPRSVPKSHTVNVAILSVYMFTYLYVMCYTYIDHGVWMYPVFGLAYNTNNVCFPLIIATIGVALYTYYRMQWFVTRIVWEKQAKEIAKQIATVFWPFYLYDTRLVYPVFIDRVLTRLSDHIIHTAIVPIAVWEMLTRPQVKSERQARLVSLLGVYSLAYWAVLFYTYIEQDYWIYPIFAYTYGTIYFPLLICYNYIHLVINYKTQWIVISILYPAKKVKISKKIK